MKNIFHNLMKHPLRKWWVFLLFGLGFFIFFHLIAFGWHQFLVYKYDKLYEEATSLGTLVDMPEAFQRAQTVASGRSIFTRPDILARETGILQSGVRSLIQQYRNDIYRMHDMIAQHIAYLRIIADETEEMIFPERREVVRRADMIEVELNSGRFTRPADLQRLLDVSSKEVEKVRTSYENARKEIVLDDIESFKHEMTYLDSLYRVTPELENGIDMKAFWKEFEFEFSESNLAELNSDELTATYTTMKSGAADYSKEGHAFALKAREDRKDLVKSEAEKWIEEKPPVAPFPDIYSQIYVSLEDQMMYLYEGGDLILSTPITSGRRNFETVRGTFKVYTKQRNKLMKSPFPDEDYELWVDYWLGFHGAYGIHDACNSKDCWRTKFGGENYVYNGSHGCINTPYNSVKFIYNWAEVGTTVHVE